MFSYGITSFVNSLAQIIQTYKVATHRKALSVELKRLNPIAPIDSGSIGNKRPRLDPRDKIF